jgi:hypothetical protein
VVDLERTEDAEIHGRGHRTTALRARYGLRPFSRREQRR